MTYIIIIYDTFHSLKSAIRLFGQDMVKWVEEALEGHPISLINVKLKGMQHHLCFYLFMSL